MGITAILKLKITKRTCEEGEAFRPGYLLFKRIQSLLEMVEFYDGKQHGVCCSFITKWDYKNKDYYSEMSFDIDNRNFWFHLSGALDFIIQNKEVKSIEDFKNFWNSETKRKVHVNQWVDFCKEFDCEIEVEEFVEQSESSKMLISSKGVHWEACTTYKDYEIDGDGNIMKSDNAEDKDDESETCSDDLPF